MHPERQKSATRLSGNRILDFPGFDQLHNITSIPKPLLQTAGHGRGYAHGAVDAGEIVEGRIERDHGDMVVDPFWSGSLSGG